MTGAQRAAGYDVLASLPEITEDPDVTTLTGKHGVAIGHASSDGLTREDLIFDPTTHKLIGTRTVNLGQRGTQTPGTVEEQSAVLQVTIVPTLAVRPDGTRLPIMPTGSTTAH